MKTDVGTSKPKKYVNKVRKVLTQKVNIGPKIKQTIHAIHTHEDYDVSYDVVYVYIVHCTCITCISYTHIGIMMCHDCICTGTYIIIIIHVHEDNDVVYVYICTCMYMKIMIWVMMVCVHVHIHIHCICYIKQDNNLVHDSTCTCISYR